MQPYSGYPLAHFYQGCVELDYHYPDKDNRSAWYLWLGKSSIVLWQEKDRDRSRNNSDHHPL